MSVNPLIVSKHDLLWDFRCFSPVTKKVVFLITESVCLALARYIFAWVKDCCSNSWPNPKLPVSIQRENTQQQVSPHRSPPTLSP
jgi:hypothetical protein